MTGYESVVAVQGWRRQVLIVMVSYCAGFTTICAANDLAHAFLGWELRSATFRYTLPLWLALWNLIWVRFFGTADSTV